MTSEHIGDRATAYVAGELPDADRAAIEQHLGECESCRAEVEAVELAFAAVSSWPKQPSLPASLEERVVRSAAAGRNSPTASAPRWWRSSAAAALLLCVLSGAAGFGAGRLTRVGSSGGSTSAATADSTLRSYMLLLEEPVWPPARPLARAGYGAWSREMAAESRFVGAEKFTEEPGFRVSATGAAARPVAERNYSGWYIVRARSYDEAIAWARRGPHLAYGSVLVREIER